MKNVNVKMMKRVKMKQLFQHTGKSKYLLFSSHGIFLKRGWKNMVPDYQIIPNQC
jgi:hypothetical protein